MTKIEERIANLSPEKLEQLFRGTQEKAQAKAAAHRIPRRPDAAAPARLSSLQQRLWFLDQLEPGTPAYNMHGAFRWRGALEPAALQASFAEIARRHEVLRSVFRRIDGEVRQVLGDGPAIDFVVEELAGGDGEARWRQRVAEEARWSFSLSEGPLVRVAAFKLADDHWVLSIALHHIVADGWSIGVLVRELAALYSSRLRGEEAELPELPIQMADFAEWQHEQLTAGALESHLDFWRQQLEGAPAVLELVTDFPRPAKRSSSGAASKVFLSADVRQRLQQRGAAQGATLYMTLLAAYQVLLWRHSGEEEVVVGSPVAGRPGVETEELIGPFTNTVVRRTSLAGDPTFNELLGKVRAATLDADAHSAMPLERLVEAFAPERSSSYSPIFQVWFVLHNTPPASFELAGVSLEPLELHSGTTRFDLTLSLAETGDGLEGFVEYSTDLFEAPTIRAFCDQLQVLCEEVAKDPDRPISRLPLITAAQRRELLEGAPQQAAEPRPWPSFEEGLATAARLAPEAPALICGDEELSWEELDRRTNQIAHHLQAMGVGPGTLVGLCLPRSLDLLLAAVGILKSGGACLPLDPKHPEERLEHMLEESEAEALITLDEMLYELPAHAAACSLLCMDSDREELEGAPSDPPDV
ncbi:MAG: AMP-binding protein, partial [Acidobacteria bacterium]|nr:AMP-binding protein [Acidobacteriota bacterium]